MISNLRITNTHTDTIKLYMSVDNKMQLMIDAGASLELFESGYTDENTLSSAGLTFNEMTYKRYWRAFSQLTNHTAPEIDPRSTLPNYEDVFTKQCKKTDDPDYDVDPKVCYLTKFDRWNATYVDCMKYLEFSYSYNGTLYTTCNYDVFCDKMVESLQAITDGGGLI